jgi:hypothetical protein
MHRVIKEVLSDYASDSLTEMAFELENSESSIADFCDRFELGNWFYDQMMLADIDIVDEVSVLADKRLKTENDDLIESRLLRQELQRQGV